VEEEKKASKKVQKKIAKRVVGLKLDPHLEEQFASGRLYACISSRPGQCGRADGYDKIKILLLCVETSMLIGM
jgi:small subunit ribosomal protein S8e